MDLHALTKIYPQTEAEKEVREWLKTNRETFSRGDRTPIEIAELAIRYAGLDPVAVRLVLGHTGAVHGERFENKNAMRELRDQWARDDFEQKKAVLEGRPTIDFLGDAKQALRNYLVDGIEFGEVA